MTARGMTIRNLVLMTSMVLKRLDPVVTSPPCFETILAQLRYAVCLYQSIEDFSSVATSSLRKAKTAHKNELKWQCRYSTKVFL